MIVFDNLEIKQSKYQYKKKKNKKTKEIKFSRYFSKCQKRIGFEPTFQFFIKGYIMRPMFDHDKEKYKK